MTTTGTAITKILPPVFRFSPTGEQSKKRESVIDNLTRFFERFFNISREYKYNNLMNTRDIETTKSVRKNNVQLIS